jgi:hypothetical protein
MPDIKKPKPAAPAVDADTGTEPSLRRITIANLTVQQVSLSVNDSIARDRQVSIQGKGSITVEADSIEALGPDVRVKIRSGVVRVTRLSGRRDPVTTD